jgi:hypothetical protein
MFDRCNPMVCDSKAGQSSGFSHACWMSRRLTTLKDCCCSDRMRPFSILPIVLIILSVQAWPAELFRTGVQRKTAERLSTSLRPVNRILPTPFEQ